MVSNILMCCLPVEHQETVFLTVDGLRSGLGWVGPHPHAKTLGTSCVSVCIVVVRDPSQVLQLASEDPHGLWEGSYDLKAVRHLQHQLSIVSPDAQWWQFPRPGGPLISMLIPHWDCPSHCKHSNCQEYSSPSLSPKYLLKIACRNYTCREKCHFFNKDS